MSKKLLCIVMSIIFMTSTIVSVSVSADMQSWTEYSTDDEGVSDAEEIYCKHSYGKWIIFSLPGCTQRGYMYRKCSLCDNIEYDTLNATGHIDDNSDNICDECNSVISVRIPVVDDGDTENNNTSDSGISSFFGSIVEFFNKILAWIKSIFGME